MVSFGSFNRKENPILKEIVGASLLDSINSFVYGFAVFTTTGFLKAIARPVASANRSSALVFIAIPAANIELGGTRVFNFFTFLFIFVMGIDVLTGIADSLVTCIYDDWYNLNNENPKKLSRIWFTAGICIIIWASGAPYYLNTGLIWLDIMDYYIFTFIGILMCVMQCLAIGWVFEHNESALKVGKKSAILFAVGYWISLVISCYIGVFHLQASQSVYMTFLIALIMFTLTTIVAWQSNPIKMEFKEWFDIMALSGARKFVAYIVKIEQI